MSWTLPWALRGLAIRQEPNIGCDAGVVEELFRQGNQSLQQVVLENVPADLALAAAGVAREKRRAVHDDGDARAALLRVFDMCEHVKQEEELAVTDAGQPCSEPAHRATLVLIAGPSARLASSPSHTADWR